MNYYTDKYNNYKFYNMNPDEIIIVGNYYLNVIDLFHWIIKQKIELSKSSIKNSYYLKEFSCFLIFLNPKKKDKNEVHDILMMKIKNGKNIFILKYFSNIEGGRIFYSPNYNNNSNPYLISVMDNTIDVYCFINVNKSIKMKNN